VKVHLKRKQKLADDLRTGGKGRDAAKKDGKHAKQWGEEAGKR
jgi:hypothetical protein